MKINIIIKDGNPIPQFSVWVQRIRVKNIQVLILLLSKASSLYYVIVL